MFENVARVVSHATQVKCHLLLLVLLLDSSEDIAMESLWARAAARKAVFFFFVEVSGDASEVLTDGLTKDRVVVISYINRLRQVRLFQKV